MNVYSMTYMYLYKLLFKPNLKNLVFLLLSFSAALKVLKMESLMSLARELTFDEGSQLGQQLGVKPEQIQRFKEEAETDPVGANFQILCHWRGR